jgi:ABC-type glycerol-3-phosphate transport system permease component
MTHGRMHHSYLRTAFLAVAAFVSLLPLLWLACATLKTGEDLFQYSLLPWDHLEHLT